MNYEDLMKFWFDSSITEFNSDEGLNPDNPFEIKRVNIIVGSNNSGKSRFMRKISHAIPDTKFMIEYPESFKSFYEELKELIETHYEESPIALLEKDIFSFEDYSLAYDNLKEDIGGLFFNYRNDPSIGRLMNTSSSGIASQNAKLKSDTIDIVSSKLYDFTQNLKGNSEYKNHNLSQEINDYPRKFHSIKGYYIPSFRGLKKLSDSANYLYRDLASKDYDYKPEKIITGEGFFEDIMQSLLGKPQQRKRVIEYQEKLSQYFFNNQEVTIIPNVKENALEIKIGNDEQYPIAHLGDGLQQVIILTYTPYLRTEQSMFFIEEPEMHLHAGYVKQIIKFLLNETNHTYFMTTHSNYLLDMINESNQITLYRVDKKQILEDDSTRIETVIKRCDQDRSVLQVLGVKPSSVFLANCTIWIEGITDRLYLVEYMKKYLKELKDQDEEKYYNYSRYIDGYHYAFVEYQGANLAHWNFETELINDVDSGKENGLNALLVTSEALVIADSDLTGKPRFEEIKNQLGFNLQITRGKETENTLPKEILVEMFYQLCPANGRSGGKTKLTKDENHLSHFKDNFEISSKGIGEYFDDTLTRLRKANIIESLTENDKAYKFSDSKSKQGTIKKKTEFCRSAIELMQDENFEWKLTESARELCEAIFNHIEKCNKEFEN